MNKAPENPPPIITHLDKNVPANWRPVPALQNRPSRMPFSDRLWYWLLSLGSLAVTATGIAVCWLLEMHGEEYGIGLIALGIFLFALGPSQAAKNGYRIHTL